MNNFDSYDLSFINDDASISYIKDMLSALVITQEHIEKEYIKMWDMTKNDMDINKDFIEILETLNGLNVFEYFNTINKFYSDDIIVSLIYNNLKYDSHSGFSMYWTFRNTQSLLICGYDNYKSIWLNRTTPTRGPL
jgi:hypothetical protein